MDAGLGLAVALAFTNGVHDASDAIAMLGTTPAPGMRIRSGSCARSV